MSTALIETRPQGLYCPPGDFYIDPWRGVSCAVITHAHGDHARWGSQLYHTSAAGEPLIKIRLGEVNTQTHEWGEPFEINGVRVSLHPAGHILGSAQVRLEYQGQVWVFTGDYKRAPDPSCEPFEVVPCDTLVTEATFALPVYRWPPGDLVADQILGWWQDNASQQRTSVLLCYSLGKAQRILAHLSSLTDQKVYLHGAAVKLVQAYREAGIEMLPTQAVSEVNKGDLLPQGLVLAPPSVAESAWLRRFRNPSVAFASGWMSVRGIRKRRNYSQGFVMSDHADWDELIATIQDTGAQRVLCTHGRSQLLVRYLNENGIQAAELATGFDSEGGE